ncbi:hypothetical protein J4462_00485 [Candidatus Pacearchaeota archaeon]|nr:hypothetical protein [Candidatus Pacearchaeota archaeon]
MKLIIFIVKFLLIGALFIVTNENLALQDQANREIFYIEFQSWISDLSTHIGEITGYIINSEWLPEDKPLEKQDPFA